MFLFLQRRVSFATDVNTNRKTAQLPDRSFETINTVLQSLENLPKSTSPIVATLPMSTSNLQHRYASNESIRLELSRYDNVSPTNATVIDGRFRDR